MDHAVIYIALETSKIDTEIYAEDPEPPRYVYRELRWDKKVLPGLIVYDVHGAPRVRTTFIGLGHWENGREYRLDGFTKIKKDDELILHFPYSGANGKMKFARFELQSKETDQ